jgi:hypothetical protein
MQEPARGLAQADDKGRARATAPRLPMTRSARGWMRLATSPDAEYSS